MLIKLNGFLLFFFLMITIISLSMPLSAQTRRALVIGIGQQEDMAWGKINGDKDVAYVAEMLKGAYKE